MLTTETPTHKYGWFLMISIVTGHRENAHARKINTLKIIIIKKKKTGRQLFVERRTGSTTVIKNQSYYK